MRLLFKKEIRRSVISRRIGFPVPGLCTRCISDPSPGESITRPPGKLRPATSSNKSKINFSRNEFEQAFHVARRRMRSRRVIAARQGFFISYRQQRRPAIAWEVETVTGAAYTKRIQPRKKYNQREQDENGRQEKQTRNTRVANFP